MKRFESERPVRPVPAVAGRARLLTLVIALILVVMLMAEARQPSNWRWLWILTGESVTPPGDNAPAAVETSPTVDTRVPPLDSDATSLDTVRIAPSPLRTTAPETPAPSDVELSAIKDDTSIRASEQTALFRLLEIESFFAASKPATTYAAVSFAQLYRQPDVYRGRRITTRGTIRRITIRHAPNNDAGISDFYEIWLQPHDNPTAPLAIYVHELPDGLVPAESVDQPASVRGVFFKRWAYQAQDVPRAAPLILAATVHPEQATIPARTDDGPLALWQIVALAAVAAAGFVAVVQRRARTRSRRRLAEKIPST